MDFSTWDSNLHNFVRKFVNPEGFTVFTFKKYIWLKKWRVKNWGRKKRNCWWGSHLCMSWGDVDFLSLRPFRKSPVGLVSWEAIFEVVAPSDVEDPRRPCGRHGHGALCHLGYKKKDFAREKWWILGPVIPGIRRFSGLWLSFASDSWFQIFIFFGGCDYDSLVSFDLVFGPSKDESKATGDSMCPINIPFQFIHAKQTPSFWMTLRLTDSRGSGEVAGCQMSGLATSHLRYIIFCKTSKAFFSQGDGTTETKNSPSFAERGLIWSDKTWLEFLVPSASFWDTAVLDIFVKRKDPKCSWSHRSKIAILAKKISSLKLT